MFNSKAEFTVPILSGETKRCKMRFPSDQEWAERVRKQSIVEKDLGRGESVREAEGTQKADAELLDKIRVDDRAVIFDEFEASAFIEKLERCEILSTEPTGNQVRIELLAMGKFPLVHVLKMPTQKHLFEFRRGSFRRRMGRGYEKVVLSLEPGAELWNDLKVSSEGYAEGSDVPIIHKDRAITALMREVERISEEPDPEV